FMGPELPFSPRNVVVDVHRVFFKRLPAPPQAGYSGVVRGELDDETVEETWRDGQLRASAFTRPGGGRFASSWGRAALGRGASPSRRRCATSGSVTRWRSSTRATKASR